jgi:hypothetical protein
MSLDWNQLAGRIRMAFPEQPDFPLARNLSIAKQLVRKYGLEDARVCIEGAALLRWRDLRGLQAADGVGRRWAQARYWHQRNTDRSWRAPEPLKAIFRELAQ